MFDYNVFDTITMKLAKHKFGRKILDEIKELPENEKVAYCEKLKAKLQVERVKYLEDVTEKMDIRDRKEEEWMETYATGDKKADAFDAGDYAYEENKALAKSIKTFVKCEGAIHACDAIIKKINKMQQTARK